MGGATLLLLLGTQVASETGSVGANREGIDASAPAEAASSLDAKPGYVEGQFGVGTIVGTLGLLVGYDVHERFQAGGGVGLGSDGVAVGAYLRARPWILRGARWHAATVQMGWSGGPFKAGEPLLNNSSDGAFDLTKVDWAWWYQVDVGYEGELQSGAILRGAVGYAFLVNRGDAYCVPKTRESPGSDGEPSDCPTLDRDNLWGIPTVSVSLGWRW